MDKVTNARNRNSQSLSFEYTERCFRLLLQIRVLTKP